MTYLDLPLYPDQPAGTNLGIENGTDRPLRLIVEVGQPQLSVVIADHPSGAAALIFPGGGYRRVCVDKEGLDMARHMAAWGLTTMVLTYRQPGGVFTDPPLPLVDARRALALAAQRGPDWGFDPEKLVLMGFSAGGHLALTALREPGADARIPRFLVLGYPVVSLKPPLVHEGSRDNLLGTDAPAKLIERFSHGRAFPQNPERVFLLHADDDKSVPVGNSLALAQTFTEAGVPVELLRHPTGGHGFGMGPAHGYETAPDWMPRLRAWMRTSGLAR